MEASAITAASSSSSAASQTFLFHQLPGPQRPLAAGGALAAGLVGEKAQGVQRQIPRPVLVGEDDDAPPSR